MTKTLLALALLAGVALSCAPPEESNTFLALERDFADFQTWHAYDLGDAGPDAFHPAGDRVVYINQLPDAGSTTFPVGTIVVKTVNGFVESGQAFAMAKRGGNTNSLGAKGWEWFELVPAPTGQPLINWRGIAPPAGAGYGPATGGSCNQCHVDFAPNDYVGSQPLQLTSF